MKSHATHTRQNIKVSASRRPLEWLGWLFFLSGTLGLVFPLIPTMIFWIGAAWCWSRSSPHRLQRLLDHPRLGKPVQQFIDNGEIGLAAKIAAIGGISFSFTCWILLAQPSQQIVIWVTVGFAMLVTWVASRPTPVAED